MASDPHLPTGSEQPATAAVRIDRELSWLDFNGRVVDLAEQASLPLLERVRFLGIASRNLDEFYQVRIAGLLEQLRAAVIADDDPGGASKTPDLAMGSPIVEVRRRAHVVAHRMEALFLQEIVPALAESGIRFVSWEGLDEDARHHLTRVFETRIRPVLTPLAVDPAHPFPYISSLSLNLAVITEADGGRNRISRLKVPPLLPPFLALPDGERFVPVEEVIGAHLSRLFPSSELVGHHVFRVTRSADFTMEDSDADDLVEAVREVLRRRRRSPVAVRLQVDTEMDSNVLGLLRSELGVDTEAVDRSAAPLDLGGLLAVAELARADLHFPAKKAVVPAAFAGLPDPGRDIFAVIRERDRLVHHPYESFEETVTEFIEAAASDPHVLAIKQTVYRTSGPSSSIIRALIRAAEVGKQAVALIELTARFDEEANINWARVLEEAGVHVVYGRVGIKTHAKLTLVVRDEGEIVRQYVHVGTGNYNPTTARIYEDLSLFSADPALADEVAEMFNSLTTLSAPPHFDRLIAAPERLRRELVQLIKGEAHPHGRIVLKANGLVDEVVINALCAASSAGASIDLIIRGICCLRPGVPGASENIRVRSIVGRYLEHSRVLRFGADPATATLLIGSADLMPRNLERRVEAAVRITDPALRLRINGMLDRLLQDDSFAWELQPDGTWTRLTGGRSAAHEQLWQDAAERASAGE